MQTLFQKPLHAGGVCYFRNHFMPVVFVISETTSCRWCLLFQKPLHAGGVCCFRNHFMQVVFGSLVMLGHAVLIIDILPVLTLFETDGNHTLVPLTLLFTNLLFYQLSCTSNPGEITKHNVDALLTVYKADDFLYKPDVQCRTCKITKPARSKHCSKSRG
jgi:hypothetical protein